MGSSPGVGVEYDCTDSEGWVFQACRYVARLDFRGEEPGLVLQDTYLSLEDRWKLDGTYPWPQGEI